LRAVGMAGKDWTRQAKHSLLNKHLQADTASGFSARHRPQRNKRPTVGRWCSKTTAADVEVGLSLAVQVRGGSTGVLAAMKVGADLPTPVPTPPIAFACHCPYPLP